MSEVVFYHYYNKETKLYHFTKRDIIVDPELDYVLVRPPSFDWEIENAIWTGTEWNVVSIE